MARVARFVDIEGIEKQYIQALQQSDNNTTEDKPNTNPNSKSKSNTTSALTNHYLDKSEYLEYLIDTEYIYWEDLLGELQLAFILFLLLYSYPALKHWQKCIHLICNSKGYMLKNQAFISRFMRILFHQLNFAPYDFFIEEISKNNFLRNSLSNLISNLYSIDIDTIENIENKNDAVDMGVDTDINTVDGNEMELDDTNTNTSNNNNTNGLSDTTREVRKRLLLFLTKKFDLFQEDSPELLKYKEKLNKLTKTHILGSRSGIMSGSVSGSPLGMNPANGSAVEGLTLTPDDRYMLTDDLPTVLDTYEMDMYNRLMQADGTDGVVVEQVDVCDVPTTTTTTTTAGASNASVGWSEIDNKILELYPDHSNANANIIPFPPMPPMSTTITTTQPQSVASTSTPNPSASASGMTTIEKEHYKYGWRFPLLYDIMVLYSIAMKESNPNPNPNPDPATGPGPNKRIDLEKMATSGSSNSYGNGNRGVRGDSLGLFTLPHTKLDMVMTARLILDEWPIDIDRGGGASGDGDGDGGCEMSIHSSIVWNALVNTNNTNDTNTSNTGNTSNTDNIEYLETVWKEANYFIESEAIYS